MSKIMRIDDDDDDDDDDDEWWFLGSIQSTKARAPNWIK